MTTNKMVEQPRDAIKVLYSIYSNKVSILLINTIELNVIL